MGKKLRIFLLILALLAVCNVQAAIYYVDREHPLANDSNPGSEELPWKTLVYAAKVAGAGDTVWVKAGIYADGDVVVGHSGTLGKEIVFAAYPGHERRAVIKGAAFLSYGKSHLVVRDLKVLESPSQGFRFEGPADPADPPAQNITISGVHTYDTCSSAISIWGVKWGNNPGDYDNIRDVVIENNLLELGTHGCKNEIITVANGAVNITVRNNEIRLGDPAMEGGDEGIDFKEGVRDSRIYGNYIHDLSDKAIYIDGGSDPHDPQITNIHIYDNVMMDLPSAGIVVTTEGEGDVDGVYVYNNIVAHVEGDGYRVYDHPGGKADGGTVKNVHFINNTAVDTGLDYGGGFRVNHETATGILFRNNIAWNNRSYDIRTEQDTVVEANLCRESLCEIQEAPQFVSMAQDDYRLQATSPAIDRGLFVGAPAFDIGGNARPQGNGPDLGAWEYLTSSDDKPVLEPVPEPDPVVEPEPVVTPEPDPVVEPEPVVVPEPDPVVEPEPVVTPEPDPVIEPEPVVTPEPNPVVEPEPVVTPVPDPVVEPEPVVVPEPDPVVEPEPVMTPEPDPVVEPEPVPVVDTTPPMVSFIRPSADTNVSRTVTVEIAALDETGISQVRLYIDGILLGKDSSAPYRFYWNTRKVPVGSHTLKATAEDWSGNSAISEITVDVHAVSKYRRTGKQREWRR